MQDYRNSDYHPDDLYDCNRTKYFPEAQPSYRHIDCPEDHHGFGHVGYPEGQPNHGYTGYPDGQYSYRHVDYPTGEQQGYGHVNNPSEDQYRTGQIYYDAAQSYDSSEPASHSHINKIPYDDRLQKDADWYLKEKNRSYMYEEGSRGDNNLLSEYPTSRLHENRVPEYYLPRVETEPYPPEFDPMAWNMMNSAGGWHEFRGP